MKIQLVSDLHLEFEDLLLKNEKSADVLILSGDILVADDLRNQPVNLSWNDVEESGFNRAKRALRYREFFQRVSFQFPHVIYVMGNHEHYHGKFDHSADIIRQTLGYLNISNLHLLDNDTKDIDGVRFVGGTMWTDCNKGDPITLYHLEQCMNDFRVIRIAGENFRKFLPKRTVDEHRKTKSYIKLMVESTPTDMPVVVCTHHAPSFLSVHEMYKHDHLMNGGYASDLSDLMLDQPKIKLWTHGHMHQCFDYKVGDVRVVCNPRGYPGENSSFDQQKIIEI
jgi:Icc-related predicted phosphoesterase